MTDGSQAEFKEINNELVVPEYRRFCDEFNLPFHFADELPPGSIPSEILRKELRLHQEAMDIFNEVKPAFASFKGDVIAYRFTDWGGDFTYVRKSATDFIAEAADRLVYLHHLEKRFDLLSSLFAVGIFAVTFGTASRLIVPAFSERFREWADIGALLLAISLAASSWWLFRRMPKRADEEPELKRIATRISQLQLNLAKIRGNRPDPLRQKRLGSAVLTELRESMSEDEIRGLVRKMQLGLFLVKDDERL